MWRTLSGFVFVLWLNGCVVSVPNVDEDLFACTGNKDWASGFSCVNGLCNNTGTSAGGGKCPKVCGSDEVCAKSSGGGACIKSCNDFFDCGRDAACVYVPAYNPAGDIQPQDRGVCLACDSACSGIGDQRCYLSTDNPDGLVDKLKASCSGRKSCGADKDCPARSFLACAKESATSSSCYPTDAGCRCKATKERACTPGMSCNGGSSTCSICGQCPICIDAMTCQAPVVANHADQAGNPVCR